MIRCVASRAPTHRAGKTDKITAVSHDPYDEFSQPADEPDPPGPPPHDNAYPQPVTQARVTCTRCGYNLTGVSIGGKCPECGAPVDHSLYAAGAATVNAFAITSMVIGIVSVVGLCCCWGGFIGILGLIFGFIAMNQIKTGTYSSSSYGMALAGLICSGTALACTLIFVIIAILG